MSYLLTLEEPASKKLVALAEKQRLPASKLIEQVVVDYLSSLGEDQDPDGGANPKSDTGAVSHRDLYRWDEEKATIRFLPSNRRVLVMNAHAWDSVEESLILSLGGGAAHLLSSMGYAFGRMIAQDYRSVAAEPGNIGSYFEYLSLAAGWGKFSISGDTSAGSKVNVKVKDCVFCGSRNASLGRRDPCSFLMGVCEGTVDTVFDSSHYVYENKCLAKGNDCCEIILSKVS
jgi:predicted hydrocarbon binding protein